MVKTLLVLVLSAATLYLAVLAFLWLRQESLMFYPVPLAPGFPLATQGDVHESTLQVDGAQLSMLHLKLPAPKGVVFYLHGNAGNLSGWFTHAEYYRAANFDLVMPDYRGYGKSSGHIASARQLREDVRAAWNSVAAQYRGKRIVLYGRSLGTGLTADLARQLTAEGAAPDLTVLVSAYTSIRDLTREIYPWVPGALLRYPLDTAQHLPHVGGAILLVHGERDEMIGLHHARALHQRVPAARLLVLPGAGHNDIHEWPAYREVFHAALAQL